MEFLLPLLFVIGYLAIATEHFIHANKAATALLTGILCWTGVALTHQNPSETSAHLLEHLGEISGILFFLMGAMTIVELIDTHGGFSVITDRITTRKKRSLIWIIGIISFFLSAILDNLTTTIVMVMLCRKLLDSQQDRLLFAGIIVIAANAGGAWTPIGDVTTTMLWIGGQITPWAIMTRLFLPSLACLLVPLFVVSRTVKGETKMVQANGGKELPSPHGNLVFAMGIGALVFTPVFKTVTHLPPFMGVLFGLGLMWLVIELLHKKSGEELRHKFAIQRSLERIDTPSILFFLGILLAVSALDTSGHLQQLSGWLATVIPGEGLLVLLIGLMSAVIDNVPLVAATQGMYTLQQYPTDHFFWEFLAYCAGTGGSILIIGSAAGVAAMGLEKIEFFWYLRKISLYALIGYLGGAGVYVLLA